MTVLVKFQIEIRFFHWIAWKFKIVDDVMSTIICNIPSSAIYTLEAHNKWCEYKWPQVVVKPL